MRAPCLNRNNSGLTIQLISGREALEHMGSSWDALFEQVSWAPFQLSRPWLQQMAMLSTPRSGQLVVVCAFDGNMLVAMFAMVIRRWLTVKEGRPLGSRVPGYLGILADPERVDALREIVWFCLQQRVFDVLCLNDVSTDDRATHGMIDLFLAQGALILYERRSVCRRIHLQSSYEDYLTSQTSSKRRAKLRWEERRLSQSASIVIERYIGREVTSEIIDRIAQIQEHSWLKERGAPILNTPFYRSLYLALASAGMARVWLMKVDGVDGAFWLGVVAKETIHAVHTAFKMEYDRLSIGKILLGQVIRDACEEDLLILDFGHSDSEYKRFWSNDSHVVDRFFVGVSMAGKVVARSLHCGWRVARNPKIRIMLRTARLRLRSAIGGD